MVEKVANRAIPEWNLRGTGSAGKLIAAAGGHPWRPGPPSP
ncbi:MAG: hypothetical protein ACRDUV_03180 [Pseudonocardiaceae bacterium]